MKPVKDKYLNTGKTALTFAAICFSLKSHAVVIINEIDYDQPGADTAEYIELFNTGDSTVSLDSFTISLINGGNDTEYLSISLSGFSLNANDYFVVCNDGSVVANCDYEFTSSSGWFQNGAPDAVALFDDFSIVDSLAYEGEFTPYTEGSALTLADSNSIVMSISRLPNGIDLDNNGLDFSSGCLTPGSANVGGTGDCSTPDTVPLPASVWLFVSGLAGLLGVTRQKNILKNKLEK